VSTKRRSSRPRTTPEERAAKVEALAGELTAAVDALTTDDAWLSMLRTAAQFHHYSINNVLLLWAQAEARQMELSAVAGYQRWVSLGRSVRKGERGLKIFAPCRYRLSAKEAAELGPSAYDNQGQPRVVVRGFKIEYVFDIAQTEGEPLTEPPGPQALTGTGPAGLWDAVSRIVTTKGYRIERRHPSTLGAFGSVHFEDREVRIRPDVDEAQACKTLVHELGHIEADHYYTRRDEISRAQRETEAESIAYVVANAYGLNTEGYSVPYIASWSSGDPEVIRAAATAVHKAAASILAALEAASASGNSDTNDEMADVALAEVVQRVELLEPVG
jgi:antirestriction protein ArdC